MAIENLFILGGMPASGKSTFVERHSSPPHNWPIAHWWSDHTKARYLKSLSDSEAENLPSKLAVHLDFSSADLKPQIEPTRNFIHTDLQTGLNPEYIAFITFWAPTHVLCQRFNEREHESKSKHSHHKWLIKIYDDPDRLKDYYREWLSCVNSCRHDDHWVYDSHEQEFHSGEEVSEMIGLK